MLLLLSFMTRYAHSNDTLQSFNETQDVAISGRLEMQTQTDTSDVSISPLKGEALLESNTLSQQLKLIELKALLAKIKNDIGQAPYCLSDKDYTPIMQLLQKKMDILAAQIKTLESSLPEQPESIDIEDLLQKSFTIIAASFVAIIVLCLIIQSSRENGQYHFPSITRLMKNI